MNENGAPHPIVELRKVSQLEKRLVNRLLQLGEPASQTVIMDGMQDIPSQPTVSRAISSLVEKGIVLRSGRTKGSRFALTPTARHFATPPAARAPLAFDPFRIASYVPNATRWMPEPLRDRMERASEGARGQLDASTYSRQIAERFMVNLSWASSHLEGNTYDFLDTEMLIRYGTEADGHDRSEVLMLLNHKRAIGRLLEGVGHGLPDEREAHRLHALMMNGLMDPGDIGRIRNHSVRISTSSYRPSTDPAELSSQQALIMTRAREVDDPFEASFFLLTATSYLQAFGDGNKRMGRLLANAPLLEAGMPPLSFVDIDANGYILGLIDFYETASTELLAEAIAENYALTAPHFQAAYSTQRVPRQIEINEGQRIAGCIQGIVNDGAALADVEGRVATTFEDLDEETRGDLCDVIRERLKGFNPAQAVIYGLTDEQVAAWIGVTDREL